jgi:transcription termination/antitermination protein NusA
MKLSTEHIAALTEELAKFKNLDAEVVLESVKEALISAARKYTGIQKRFEVEVDEESKQFRVFLNVEVVDDFPDAPEDATAEEVARLDEHYMLLDEALDYNEELEVGDQLTLEVDVEAFGRQAILLAKQIFQQKVRDAERKRVLAEYNGRIGTLVSATVNTIERGNLLLNLGKTEAILPVRHQMRKDRFKVGDTVLALIHDVSDGAKGAQVVLSRTDSRFLLELLRRDVTEVYEGTIEILGIAREAGVRSKIAVYSNDDRMDPVGAMVGPRGSRIQLITRELNNERIDIITWSDDLLSYVRKAMSPVEVRQVKEIEGVSRILVLVNDDEIALAIGKNRANQRLVSQLVGREIEIYGDSEWNQYSPDEQEDIMAVRKSDKPLSPEAAARFSAHRKKFSELNALFRDEQEQ